MTIKMLPFFHRRQYQLSVFVLPISFCFIFAGKLVFFVKLDIQYFLSTTVLMKYFQATNLFNF